MEGSDDVGKSSNGCASGGNQQKSSGGGCGDSASTISLGKTYSCGSNSESTTTASGDHGRSDEDSASAGPKACRRCKKNEGTISMRGQPTCTDCFVPFARLKVVKRLNTLHRNLADMRGSRAPQKTRYLCGLSFGPSSAVLLSMLHDNIEYLEQKGRGGIAYAVTVVHIDTTLNEAGRLAATALLEMYQARFPRLSFEHYALEDALQLRGVNWAALGVELPHKEGEELRQDRARRLRGALDTLHSVSARMDILRLMVRHALVSRAVQSGCDAVLLGTNMTGLAELAFSEVAKGRGASVPWLTQDGMFPLPSFGSVVGQEEEIDGAQQGNITGRTSIPVYHLLRDVFRGEVLTFSGLAIPTPLTPLIPSLAENKQQQQMAKKTIVSHKNLSIEEVMARFFNDAETAGQASVVSNVVRTTDRLARLCENMSQMCEICGLPLDGEGDERWRGEIGVQEDEEETKGLCHGCHRSLTS
ncbi:Cytoplasmic tRNA 2-thiolation protein 2 [Ceratocystis fimbriata CBS 114723]|uniref:Cytoplasmic tRNA 2-thiolation protein 2 n=1 Tax=Ceratocystis fimbriata CBS 114723 TaxID=1035309 RepID=A0A2C5X5V7_9PEZI|nr:Cytoplasmic tRNA 2-thiolation protein 2 [Ceratocystis fimbriata CBS 114723]